MNPTPKAAPGVSVEEILADLQVHYNNTDSFNGFRKPLKSALTALLASAAGGQEPVVWQYRMKRDQDDAWGPWAECSKSKYEQMTKDPVYLAWEPWRLEVRKLYAQPPSPVGAPQEITTDEVRAALATFNNDNNETGTRAMRRALENFAANRLAATPAGAALPLKVQYRKMPESCGRNNWTALLCGNGADYTIDRSEYPHRVRYAADCVRHIIGELPEKPFILDYDADERTPCHLCGGSGSLDGKSCPGLKFDGTAHDEPALPLSGAPVAPTSLWANVRAIKSALTGETGKQTLPYLYAEQVAIDDIEFLFRAPLSGGVQGDAARAIVSAYSIPTSEKPFSEEIVIQRMRQIEGPALWSVKLGGNCLNKSGEWEWEPMPSSRDDGFLARCRFDSSTEAISAAIASQQDGGRGQ